MSIPRSAIPLLLLAALAGASPPCGDWGLVPTPNTGNSVNRLSALAAISPNDAWAVGHWRDDPAPFGPLCMRWDGMEWSNTALPDTSHLGARPEIEGVDAAPNADVWVVGNVTTQYPAYNLPLVLRWRNDAWDLVETVALRPQTEYPYADRGGFLFEVDALAPDDVWAVGQAVGFGDAGATSVPLAAHWNGSTWTDIDVPRIANRHHQLNDVAAIAPDDVWAVGDYRNIAGPFRAVAYHWDGLHWSHIPSPIEDLPHSGLFDIAATGPDDVWAIGSAADAGILLMHWDGDQWSLMQPPPNSGGSIAAVGPNDLWASGWDGFWHWDGSAWTEVPASVPGAAFVIRGGGLEVLNGCDIWSAGFWTLEDGITSSTLAERLSAACAPDFDQSGTLDLFDFLSFVNAFNAGNPAADFDHNGVLDLFDFLAFVNAFNAGC